MKRRGTTSSTMRLAAAVGAGVLALTCAGPVAASDPFKPSKDCRKTVALEVGKLAKLTAKLVDTCHKKQMKAGLPRAECNIIDSALMDPPTASAPSGKYDAYKA